VVTKGETTLVGIRNGFRGYFHPQDTGKRLMEPLGWATGLRSQLEVPVAENRRSQTKEPEPPELRR
jgi:hypothetical protein